MKPYLKYIYEVFAIVIGITMSFMVDEWREDRREKLEIRQGLQKMLVDLGEDSILLERSIKVRIRKYKEQWKVYRYLEGDKEIIHPDSVSLRFLGSYAINPIMVSNQTFKEMEYTGNLIHIKSDTLKSILGWYFNHEDIQLWNPLMAERNWKINDVLQTRYERLYDVILPESVLNEGDIRENNSVFESLTDQEIYEDVVSTLDAVDFNYDFKYLMRNSLRTTVRVIDVERELQWMNNELRRLVSSELRQWE